MQSKRGAKEKKSGGVADTNGEDGEMLKDNMSNLSRDQQAQEAGRKKP